MNIKTLLVCCVLLSLTLSLGCTKKTPTAPEASDQTPAAQNGAVNPVAGAPGARPATAVQQMVRLPFNLPPTESQKIELEKLQQKYGERLEAARKGVAGALTDEQKKARMEAGAKARTAGKVGKDLVDAINNAVKMTPEQQQKLTAAQQELTKVSQEMNKEMMALLTPEQKAEMKKKAEEIRKNNPMAAKPQAPVNHPAPNNAHKKPVPSPAKHAAPKTKF